MAKETEKKKDYALLEDSVVTGTKRREVGAAEACRRKNNAARDGRTNLGVGKPATITEA